jgi:CheY-like chemotaxis protein
MPYTTATNVDFNQIRILLVDDASFVRTITSKMLLNLGVAEIREAEHGQQAISILNEHDVDLLSTDIQMPEMNGIELIKQIRLGNTQKDRGLRTLVETSFSNPEVLASCLSLDVNGFLVKPFTPELVQEKLHLALTEHIHLQTEFNYLQVKTNLDSLAEHARRPQAIITQQISQHELKQGKSIELRALQPGMKLLENLKTQSGMLMLAAGSILNESLVNRIVDLEKIIASSRILVLLDPPD